ncbi:MarR family winged helix-turn-helix transcriptional regulator [Celeribacter indicus]|uniref:MarR family transcriptional regulator n=1 Tax=Celeribacter indicus TaxID=1208324 RepID=A0A0B5E175_9RHOB|nr:MarR family transcriptional regulator [Celeribacter indicus]AJE46182.1 MarR family transcriptional regulator [Celeribacter indicus]SDW49265.1 DNA-binding transcriptional regulator, MarR family [Celeribacter indicus]
MAKDMQEITDENLRQFAGYNMKRAFLMVRDDLGRTLQEFGLRMTSFSALAIIIENPDVSQSRLAEALHIERSGVVVLVDELESADLIARNRVEGDRRQYALRATPEGEAVWTRAEAAVHAHEERIFAGLGAGERQRLADLLRRVGRG